MIYNKEMLYREYSIRNLSDNQVGLTRQLLVYSDDVYLVEK
jgi:hypothetical protein